MTCLHSYMSIYSKLIFYTDSKHVLHFLQLHVQNTKKKTGNDVSEFTHSKLAYIILLFKSEIHEPIS